MPRISVPALPAVFLLAIAALTPPAHGQSYPLAPPPGPQIYPHQFEDSNAVFHPIFDGGTLHNWDDDTKH
jgi:hypothetical protein